MEPAEAFRYQAQACAALGSPMYAGLLDRLAQDIESGGPAAMVIEGHHDDPGPSALALRLLGSVHRLVLERRAGDLAAFYPSVGGTWEVAGGFTAFLGLLERRGEVVREWLDRPPQTNEVGRAAALMGGLLHLDAVERLPVRLFEIGASGGLNLLADRFFYCDEGGAWFGDPLSPVRLDPAWRGAALRPWPALQILDRLGCDLRPVDPTTTEGRLALTAYVWPDQEHRLERLRGALALARAAQPEVVPQGAADFLDGIELHEGAITVLWHSVMWQYLPVEERNRLRDRIAVLGAQAIEEARFAHLSLEPTRRDPGGDREFLVVLTTWPGGVRRVLGRAEPHGLPVEWEPTGP